MNCGLRTADRGLNAGVRGKWSSCAVHSAFRNRESAFSLTEVMFAVIVLGIGFILIAAIFPVSIAQSRLTVDETTAAGSARSALAFTSRIAEGGDVTTNGPAGLLPTTDMFTAPPATTAARNPALIPVDAGQQVRVGKVLSFNDGRLATTDPQEVPPPDVAGNTIDYRKNLWNAIKGSIILPSDSRYAWVPLYRRDMIYYNPNLTGTINVGQAGLIATPSPFAQVYFIPVAVRNRSTYDQTATSPDLVAVGTGANRVPANLAPKLVRLQIRYIAEGNDNFAIFDTSAGPGGNYESVVEGSYVIVSDDKIISPASDIGLMNGRTYRVGNRRVDLDTAAGVTNGQVWELAPGGEMKADPGADGVLGNADDISAIGAPGAFPSTVQVSEAADAFIIGRNAIGPGVFEGVAQDIGVYVTYVKAN